MQANFDALEAHGQSEVRRTPSPPPPPPLPVTLLARPPAAILHTAHRASIPAKNIHPSLAARERQRTPPVSSAPTPPLPNNGSKTSILSSTQDAPTAYPSPPPDYVSTVKRNDRLSTTASPPPPLSRTSLLLKQTQALGSTSSISVVSQSSIPSSTKNVTVAQMQNTVALAEATTSQVSYHEAVVFGEKLIDDRQPSPSWRANRNGPLPHSDASDQTKKGRPSYNDGKTLSSGEPPSQKTVLDPTTRTSTIVITGKWAEKDKHEPTVS